VARLTTVRVSSVLAVEASRLWHHVVTIDGVNRELRPWFRMTVPRGFRGKSIADLEPGARPGRSWLLLGGVVPVDFDDFGLAEIEPPRRFLERSRMPALEPWEHERVIEPLGRSSCRVTDTLGFALRRGPSAIPGAAQLAGGIVGALFRHRHRRLAKLYGETDR
jgi:hypothetical protein